MKKFYIAAAVILAACSIAASFSACKDKSTDETTSGTAQKNISSTAETSTDIDGTAYSLGDDGYKYVITDAPEIEDKNENKAEKETVALPSNAKPTKPYINEFKTESTVHAETVKTTVSSETVRQESKGISVLARTTPVSKGNSASITIIGEPNKTYSIEFYKTSTAISTASGLGNVTANSNGIASWTFEIEGDCEAGNRKIIIKEKGSDNFVQTSITIE